MPVIITNSTIGATYHIVADTNRSEALMIVALKPDWRPITISASLPELIKQRRFNPMEFDHSEERNKQLSPITIVPVGILWKYGMPMNLQFLPRLMFHHFASSLLQNVVFMALNDLIAWLTTNGKRSRSGYCL